MERFSTAATVEFGECTLLRKLLRSSSVVGCERNSYCSLHVRQCRSRQHYCYYYQNNYDQANVSSAAASIATATSLTLLSCQTGTTTCCCTKQLRALRNTVATEARSQNLHSAFVHRLTKQYMHVMCHIITTYLSSQSDKVDHFLFDSPLAQTADLPQGPWLKSQQQATNQYT
eukprot:291-Heterococcus_DN1.PRE.1